MAASPIHQSRLPYRADRTALYFPGEDATILGRAELASPAGICAELSRMAYYPAEQDSAASARLSAELAAAGFGPPHVMASGSSQGFAAQGADGTAYLAFRGTQVTQPQDALDDLAFLLVKVDHIDGAVHQGFARAYARLAGLVDTWLATLPPSTRVIATGHSLGAAIATLCAARWRHLELITFGSPRVGNAEFCASFAGRHVQRYVDCCDAVTMVPPELLGCDHVQPMRYIDRHGVLHDDAPLAIAVRMDQWLGRVSYMLRYAWRPGTVKLRGLADHAPANYVRAFAVPASGVRATIPPSARQSVPAHAHEPHEEA